jgi:hypothetical protein
MDASLISHPRGDGSFMNGASWLVGSCTPAPSDALYLRQPTPSLSLIATVTMDPNTPRTANQNLIAWHDARPEHVRPLALRFTAREITLDGGNLRLVKAVDKLTGASWGRVNLHADGSFECYAVTDPPPEAVPGYKAGPALPPKSEAISSPEIEHVEADPIIEPEPGVRKTWGDRKSSRK